MNFVVRTGEWCWRKLATLGACIVCCVLWAFYAQFGIRMEVAVFWASHTDALYLKRLVSRADFTGFSGSIVEQSWLAYWALLGWLIPKLRSITGQALNSVTVRSLLWTHALISHLHSIHRALNQTLTGFRGRIPSSSLSTCHTNPIHRHIISSLRAGQTFSFLINRFILRTSFTSLRNCIKHESLNTTITLFGISIPLFGCFACSTGNSIPNRLRNRALTNLLLRVINLPVRTQLS